MMIKKALLLTICYLILSFGIAQPYQETRVLYEKDIKTGASQIDKYLPLLTGKRVAIIANVTSLIDKTHLVDTLLSLKINVKKIFSPEQPYIAIKIKKQDYRLYPYTANT
jgi:uncharacterized protein YbbC (DUF1343 family)